MPVFTLNQQMTVTEAVGVVARDFFYRTPLILSEEDFIAAFINPAHVKMLREVESITGKIGGNSSNAMLHYTGGGRVGILRTAINFTGSPPIILPQYITEGLQPTCPDGLGYRIQSWINDRVSAGLAFGEVRDAVDMLNDLVPDARTMAIFLPCITALMAMTGRKDMGKKATALAQNTKVGKLPRMSTEVKEIMREASAIFSAAHMALSAPVPEAPKGSATIMAQTWGHTFVPAMSRIIQTQRAAFY
jgi:hypothetical protein